MTGRGAHWHEPKAERLDITAAPGYACRDCGAALPIEAGRSFSVMGIKPRHPPKHTERVRCDVCGAPHTVTWSMSGSQVKIDVERAE